MQALPNAYCLAHLNTEALGATKELPNLQPGTLKSGKDQFYEGGTLLRKRNDPSHERKEAINTSKDTPDEPLTGTA